MKQLMLAIGFLMCASSVYSIDRGLLGTRPSLEFFDLNRVPVSLQSLLDGDRNVVIFWARNNQFSLLELSELHALKPKCPRCRVIAINVDHHDPSDADIDSAVTFFKDSSYGFPVLFDSSLQSFSRLGVAAIPSTFIFDSTGTLLWELAGYLVSDRQSLADQLLDAMPHHKTWRSKISPKAIRYYQMALSLIRDREHRLAESNLAYAISVDSTFPDPLVSLATLAQRDGRRIDADSLLDQALAIDSNFAPALLAKAMLAFSTSSEVDVDFWTQRALKSDSSVPIGHALAAWVSANRQDVSRANSSVQYAEESGAYDPEVLYVCGRTKESSGDLESAAEYYRRALRLLLVRPR